MHCAEWTEWNKRKFEVRPGKKEWNNPCTVRLGSVKGSRTWVRARWAKSGQRRVGRVLKGVVSVFYVLNLQLQLPDVHVPLVEQLPQPADLLLLLVELHEQLQTQTNSTSFTPRRRGLLGDEPEPSATSFSVLGGEQSEYPSPLTTAIWLRPSSMRLPSSEPSLVGTWFWM